MFAVLSPAKKLNLEPLSSQRTSQLDFSLPDLLPETEELIKVARKLTCAELSKLMKLSDSLAALNYDRFQTMTLPITEDNGKAAVLTFDGGTYQGLEAHTLTNGQLKYAQKNLGILSGLYGVLRPLDLIQPYRLEMGVRLKTKRGSNLYSFWGNRISHTLNKYLSSSNCSVLVNLASNEYFKSVAAQELQAKVITPHFKEIKNGVPKVVGLFAKRARGMMARYMIQNQLQKPTQLQGFREDGYRYDPSLSDDTNWIFTRE